MVVETYRQATLANHRAALPPIPSLLNATLADIADGLDRQRFTSVDLVNAYLARIKEVNDDFKAVCEVNPDALQVASALDEERLKSERRGCGPLIFHSPAQTRS